MVEFGNWNLETGKAKVDRIKSWILFSYIRSAVADSDAIRDAIQKTNAIVR